MTATIVNADDAQVVGKEPIAGVSEAMIDAAMRADGFGYAAISDTLPDLVAQTREWYRRILSAALRAVPVEALEAAYRKPSAAPMDAKTLLAEATAETLREDAAFVRLELALYDQPMYQTGHWRERVERLSRLAALAEAVAAREGALRDIVRQLRDEADLAIGGGLGAVLNALADRLENVAGPAVVAVAAPVPRLRDRLFALVETELERAYAKHGRLPWGRHEFYAIFLEEVEEVWDEIKLDGSDSRLLKEMVQAVAMCFRYFETGDRYRGAILDGSLGRDAGTTGGAS